MNITKVLKKVIKKILNRYFSKLLVYNFNTNDNILTLSFDDGPSKQHTEEILDTLKEHNIKAVFFVLGKHAVEHPDIIKRMHAEGHEIGVHGFHHSRASKVTSKIYVQGVTDTSRQLENIIGAKINKIFRPPYGDISIMTFILLILQGYKYVMWSYDSQDSFVTDDAELLSFLNKNAPDKGDICLFHDDYHQTSNILSDVISEWKSLGFKFRLIKNQ